MSSLTKVPSSKPNGALPQGPSTPAEKPRPPLNALRHGMCANCIVLHHESRESFLLLMQQHIDRFQPANEVEFGMVEEMCAAYWRQRRAWAIETASLDKQIALQPDENNADRMAAGFDTLAASPSLPLLHRYETRLHLMYQRALRTLIMLRTVKLPNEPSPISEHSPPATPTSPDARQDAGPLGDSQPAADPEALGSACFSLRDSSPAPRPRVKEFGGSA
jgi:hypothetical protein